MNILIPHHWLLEHLATKAKPKEIQQYLSLSGPSVERIEKKQGEIVYDVEVTTNRVDIMSIRGMAREAAVILNQFGINSKLKPHNLTYFNQLKCEINCLPMPKIFNTPHLNKRTMFVILNDVKRKPTPDWMAKRLKQVDLNIHDAAIDITNYVTHELGHPCHAFDYDKLMDTGGEIHIVQAQKGEKFTTLDGENFITAGKEVVFKNQAGMIIDLPSIKGTINTSIDKSTKNILLLMESIQAEKVRFASMTHSIRTIAAQLMEKNVDPHLAELVMSKATQLYQQICEAKIASKVYDDFSQKKPIKPVKITLKYINQYLGLSLDLKVIRKILTDLECQVTTQGEGRNLTLTIIPPTFRPDITIAADIIEEIARIYGYHNIPSQLMATPIPLTKPIDTDFNLENKLKVLLSNLGWQEAYTYSLVSQEIAQQSGYELKSHLKLQNPLTTDRVYLRRSLLPSLQEFIHFNPQAKKLSVFEIANIYQPNSQGLPNEELLLSLVSKQAYREVRGIVEILLEKFYLRDHKIIQSDKLNQEFFQMANIVIQQHTKTLIIGELGVLKSGLIAASIKIDSLIQVAKKHPAYKKIPNTMPVIEELTFKLLPNTPVGHVMAAILCTSDIIKAVDLKTIYQHNYSFTITYHNLKINLSTLQIEPLRKQLVKAVEHEFQAKLIGQI